MEVLNPLSLGDVYSKNEKGNMTQTSGEIVLMLKRNRTLEREGLTSSQISHFGTETLNYKPVWRS